MRKFAILTAAVLAIGVLASGAQAAPMYYTNDAAGWATAAGPVTLEDFNTATIGSLPKSTSLGIDISSVPTGTGAVNNAAMGSGRSIHYTTGTGTLTFTFGTGIYAFGIDLFDLGSVGSTTLTIGLSDGSSQALFSDFTGGTGNAQFIGFTSSTAITSVTFTNTNVGDFLEFDNLRFSTASTEVPEPASLAVWGLVSLAGVGAGWARRRNKAKAN